MRRIAEAIHHPRAPAGAQPCGFIRIVQQRNDFTGHPLVIVGFHKPP